MEEILAQIATNSNMNAKQEYTVHVAKRLTSRRVS